ncbi:MAG: hypothetical protein WBZ36_06710 [Candidatus Nitrosopolaris sp.]
MCKVHNNNFHIDEKAPVAGRGIELLSFLYNQSDKGQLYDNKQYLKDALDSIFNIKQDNTNATHERAFTVIGTIYEAAGRHVLPIDIIESVINIPSYLKKRPISIHIILHVLILHWIDM